MIDINPIEVLALKKLALINKALADSLKSPTAKREQMALLGVLMDVASRAETWAVARPTSGDLPMPLADWIGERLAGCEQIAKTKTGKDREGWLQDARYFRAVLDALGSTH